MKIGFFTVGFMPVWLRLFVGKTCGLMLHLIRFRREIVIANLDIVFGEGKWPKSIIGKIYQHFGHLAIEMLYMPSIKNGSNMAEISGLENLDQALAKGQGALVVSGHTGNWEMTAGSLASRGYKVHAVVKELKGLDNDYLNNQLRGSKQVQSIFKENAMLSIRRALKKNEVCLLVIDQHAKNKEAVKTHHFGFEASTYAAPYIISKRFSCPVVPAYSCRGKNLKDHFAHIYPEIPLVENDDPHEEARLNISAYLKSLEDFILAHPVQWIWMHDRWKVVRRKYKGQN